MTDKPTTAAGYRAEETAQVIAACLTLAGALGDLADELCIVGGLVPSMICDTPVDPSALDSGAHVGTNDLDVALEVSVLDDEHYKEIASRLRGKEFAPDTKKSGAIVRQRWSRSVAPRRLSRSRPSPTQNATNARDARRRDGRRHPRPARPRLRDAGLRRPQRWVAVPRRRGR